MEAAIAGMNRALLDFRDLNVQNNVHQLILPEQALAEYRGENER
jgi:hypothetical protein